jgi:hypothetical protein
VVEKFIQTVDGFEKVYKLLQQQVTLPGQSRSTLENYIRRIALVSLHFGKLTDDEINEYLTSLALDPRSPSRSSFKQAVYGLRYYFRLIGENKQATPLPSRKGNGASESRDNLKTTALCLTPHGTDHGWSSANLPWQKQRRTLRTKDYKGFGHRQEYGPLLPGYG